MTAEGDVKRQVREFYDQVGWQEVSEGVYQNARYEDLRPVSREYIRRCHLRVKRHLKPSGMFLLDAGSGPIQYPEYLEYSQGYQYRVCGDISILALQEARKRTGEHGMFVVCDIANLPFKPGTFDGVVSLHTVHHLPFEEHKKAYLELHRVMSPGSTGVVVNGWGWASPITKVLDFLGRLIKKIKKRLGRLEESPAAAPVPEAPVKADASSQRIGTFVRKENPKWLLEEVGSEIPLQIWVWRSVNVNFLRTFCHEGWGGRFLLRVIYRLEEWFPHLLGKYGNYPMVVIAKGDK